MEKCTISNIIKEYSEKIPNRVGFSFPEVNTEYTYKSFYDEVCEVSKGLISIGVKKGDNVGIWMTNTKEWFIFFFAIIKIGAVAVPLNTRFKSEDMKYIIDKLDIYTIVMEEGRKKDYMDIINAITPECKIDNIISTDFKSDKTITVEELIKIGKKIENKVLTEYEEKVDEEDAAIVLPTSGTEGFPKGAILKHSALIKNGFDIGERLDLNNKDNMLIQVPMFHCFGITLSMMSSLTHLSKITVISQFDSNISIDVIEKEGITCVNGVPTMFESIINNPKFNKEKVKTLKKGIMAGSNCLPNFIEKVMNEVDMTIVSVYGLTEASPGCTMTSVFDSKEKRVYTVGSNLPDVESMIVDPNTGIECNVGEEGEFITRGYNVMMGYYNMPMETEKVIKNGWLHTGDIARKDKDGYYVITGRIKDIIIRGGENISPKEVEILINSCPGVSSSVVFGIDDKTLGQRVMACVIGNTDGEKIKQQLRGRCATYKIPEYIEIVEDFPKNAAGKVLTRVLRNKYNGIYTY